MATIVADVDVGLATLTDIYNTDGSTKLGVSVNKDIGKATVHASATQFNSETISNTLISAGLNWKF